MKAINCTKHILLRGKYSQWASWAIWNPNDITDLTPVSTCPSPHAYDVGLKAHYRNDLVIVGLNAVKTITAWQNFHCSYPGCRDYYLSEVFNNPCTGGAYMTDLIKNFKVVKSTEVLAKLNDKKFLDAQVSTFCEELDDLWSGTTFDACPPYIIFLGKAAFHLYIKYYAGCNAVVKYRPQVICVPHHASRGTRNAYVAKVMEALKPWKEASCKEADPNR